MRESIILFGTSLYVLFCGYPIIISKKQYETQHLN